MKLEKLDRNKSRVQLPKLGWVKFGASRRLDGEAIRSATFAKEGGHWYVSVLVGDGVVASKAHAAPDSAVGVDRGGGGATRRSNTLAARCGTEPTVTTLVFSPVGLQQPANELRLSRLRPCGALAGALGRDAFAAKLIRC